MNRKKGIIAAGALTSFLLCGATSPQTCNDSQANNSPIVSTGDIVAAFVLVGAVIATPIILVEVHKSHHTIKGCVFSGPNGLELQTLGDDKKTYLLDGDLAKAHTGDLVKFHGNKIKSPKGSKDDQTFMVQKLNKDYGVCKVSVPSSIPAPAPSPAP